MCTDLHSTLMSTHSLSHPFFFSIHPIFQHLQSSSFLVTISFSPHYLAAFQTHVVFFIVENCAWSSLQNVHKLSIANPLIFQMIKLVLLLLTVYTSYAASKDDLLVPAVRVVRLQVDYPEAMVHDIQKIHKCVDDGNYCSPRVFCRNNLDVTLIVFMSSIRSRSSIIHSTKYE